MTDRKGQGMPETENKNILKRSLLLAWRGLMNDSETLFSYMEPDENNGNITTIFPVPQ